MATPTFFTGGHKQVPVCLWVMLSILTTGCGTLKERATPPKLSEADGEMGGQCSLASAKPYLMEWSGTDRGALETQLKRGLVAVAYSGCTLEVLSDCAVSEDRYRYTPFTPKEEERSFKTSDELYTDLSIGASKLEAAMIANGQISLKLMVVGRYEAVTHQVSASQLDGPSCKRATHVIKAVSVGAFELDAGARAESSGVSGGSANMGAKLKAGGQSSVVRGTSTKDGKFPACQNASPSGAAPPNQCSALLRLELTRITHGPEVILAQRICPSGMSFDQDANQCVRNALRANPDDPNRFVIRGDLVFDTRTGLSWQRIPPPPMPWKYAKRFCTRLNLGGNRGWRLPKKRELQSLALNKPAPKIDALAFPNTPPEPFWTFSRDKASVGDIWTVHFGTGKTDSMGSGTPRMVRCVR